MKLWSVSNQPLNVGEASSVKYRNKPLSLIVLREDEAFMPLLGRQWLGSLFLDWRTFFTLKKSKIQLETPLLAELSEACPSARGNKMYLFVCLFVSRQDSS